ncbi:cytochrome P450 [Calothrix sp. UHCC 0171]|uniref:cytochrome P450 n=1 Tax=Calothrix sp. UHCC 0171 TaxID=3110245 RepID=UPI002B1F3046|nr:cytochrome P450 [Calothrix sp. UHCC 0171]MEA5569666.1 cytochrome P450 [Calothrix sp. UHCC 0171]
MIATTNKPQLTVPGPPSSPLFGNLIQMFKFVDDSISLSRQLFQNYGSVVSLLAGGGTNIYSPHLNCPGTVLAYGADIVREVTSKHDIYHKCPLTRDLYRKRNNSLRTQPFQHFLVGLFGVNGGEHRQHRQLLMPAFHKQRIESYRDDMVALTDSELDRLKVGEEVDILELMRRLTMRIATKTLFGKDFSEEGDTFTRLLKQVGAQMGNPALSLLPFDFPGLPFHRLLNSVGELDQELRNVIQRKRAQGIDGGDVLSMLIQARDAESGVTLTDDELLGHVGVIYVAGHDTSANALTWTLFLLSQHPEIAADLLDELDSVLHGEAPTLEQLQQLPLLERVIKESMRVLSPVPWNGRVISQATSLGGYDLPEGTEVFVSIYQTHHSPEIYSQPERFHPQRWETIEPTMYEYNPFSAGSRICIGAGFAMMEIKIILAMLLMRYRLQLINKNPIHPKGLIVMSPRNGLPMLVYQQDRQFAQGVGGVRGSVREMVDLPQL